MKKAEKTGRFLFVLLAVTGALLLIMPYKGIRADIVLSGSMEPEIRTGGIVFTDTSRREPKKGDIITYQLGDTMITHRVIQIENGSYITKGDANKKEDSLLVEKRQILGTVIWTVPLLGYLAVFLKRKTIFTILMIMMLQEVILGLVRWKGERKKKSRGNII